MLYRGVWDMLPQEFEFHGGFWSNLGTIIIIRIGGEVEGLWGGGGKSGDLGEEASPLPPLIEPWLNNKDMGPGIT